jgi:hypothetical protein
MFAATVLVCGWIHPQQQQQQQHDIFQPKILKLGSQVVQSISKGRVCV